MKKLYLITLILCLFLAVSNCRKSQVAPLTRVEEEVEKVPQSSRMVDRKDAHLRIVESSGNTIGIELKNSVPVKGVQFTLKGVKATEVRTTSRTAGFLAKFNEESGIVILVSVSGDEITPGTGLIAEVICDKGGTASLLGVKIGR